MKEVKAKDRLPRGNSRMTYSFAKGRSKEIQELKENKL